jgi:hypothetical protein
VKAQLPDFVRPLESDGNEADGEWLDAMPIAFHCDLSDGMISHRCGACRDCAMLQCKTGHWCEYGKRCNPDRPMRYKQECMYSLQSQSPFELDGMCEEVKACLH